MHRRQQTGVSEDPEINPGAPPPLTGCREPRGRVSRLCGRSRGSGRGDSEGTALRCGEAGINILYPSYHRENICKKNVFFLKQQPFPPRPFPSHQPEGPEAAPRHPEPCTRARTRPPRQREDPAFP